MSKKSQRNRNETVSRCNRNETAVKKHLQIVTKEPSIELVPLEIDPDNGQFLNIHLFEKMLPTLEQFSHVFGDDSMPKVADYSEWLAYHVAFVREAAPWMFVVLVDGRPDGLCWAMNWSGNGPGVHSVELSGLAKRGTRIGATRRTIQALVKKIFDETEVYIVRSSYTEDNRSAAIALIRAGFTHPEPQRACMIRGGQEIAGIIRSITRPEWEALNNGER